MSGQQQHRKAVEPSLAQQQTRRRRKNASLVQSTDHSPGRPSLLMSPKAGASNKPPDYGGDTGGPATAATSNHYESTRLQRFVREMRDPKVREEYIATVDAHIDRQLEKALCSTTKEKGKRKAKSQATQISEQKERRQVDLSSPESIISNLQNIRSVINMQTFSALPLYYQYKLVRMLPKCDQADVHGSSGIPWIKPSVSALSNEYFTKASNLWLERLREGKLLPEAITRRSAIEQRERNKLDPFKAQHYEPIWGHKHLKSRQTVELDRIPRLVLSKPSSSRVTAEEPSSPDGSRVSSGHSSRAESPICPDTVRVSNHPSPSSFEITSRPASPAVMALSHSMLQPAVPSPLTRAAAPGVDDAVKLKGRAAKRPAKSRSAARRSAKAPVKNLLKQALTKDRTNIVTPGVRPSIAPGSVPSSSSSRTTTSELEMSENMQPPERCNGTTDSGATVTSVNVGAKRVRFDDVELKPILPGATPTQSQPSSSKATSVLTSPVGLAGLPYTLPQGITLTPLSSHQDQNRSPVIASHRTTGSTATSPSANNSIGCNDVPSKSALSNYSTSPGTTGGSNPSLVLSNGEDAVDAATMLMALKSNKTIKPPSSNSSGPNSLPATNGDDIMKKLPSHITVIPLGPEPQRSSSPSSTGSGSQVTFTLSSSGSAPPLVPPQPSSSSASASVVGQMPPVLNCACKARAMIPCVKCGAYSHDDCIGPAGVCANCQMNYGVQMYDPVVGPIPLIVNTPQALTL